MQQLRAFVDSRKKHAEEQWAAVGIDALGHAGIEGSPGRRPGAGLVDDMRQTDSEMAVSGCG